MHKHNCVGNSVMPMVRQILHDTGAEAQAVVVVFLAYASNISGH